MGCTHCPRNRFIPWKLLFYPANLKSIAAFCLSVRPIFPELNWCVVQMKQSTNHPPCVGLGLGKIFRRGGNFLWTDFSSTGVYIQKELIKWFQKFIFFLWKGLVFLTGFTEEIAFKYFLIRNIIKVFLVFQWTVISRPGKTIPACWTNIIQHVG